VLRTRRGRPSAFVLDDGEERSLLASGAFRGLLKIHLTGLPERQSFSPSKVRLVWQHFSERVRASRPWGDLPDKASVFCLRPFGAHLAGVSTADRGRHILAMIPERQSRTSRRGTHL
jgi:hypothetical protein